MKLKFGMFATSARGSLGGHSVGANASGVIAITKPRHKKTRFKSVSSITTIRVAASNAYKLLTAAQQSQWKTETENYPRLDSNGSGYTMTAQQLYISQFINLTNIGNAHNTTPSAKNLPPLAPISTFTVTIAGSFMFINYIGTLSAPSAKYIVRASPSMSSGRSRIQSQMRQIAVIVPAAQTSDNVWTQYVAVFGTPLTGQRIFVEMYGVDVVSGAACPRVQLFATVV
jgi:hypothetical protein